MAMSMSKISGCEVTECAYNSNKNCHTMAITVGAEACAMCDTFKKSDMKGGDVSTIGSVGACKADSCKFNESLECTAENIMVGIHASHADCTTFSMR